MPPNADEAYTRAAQLAATGVPPREAWAQFGEPGGEAGIQNVRKRGRRPRAAAAWVQKKEGRWRRLSRPRPLSGCACVAAVQPTYPRLRKILAVRTHQPTNSPTHPPTHQHTHPHTHTPTHTPTHTHTHPHTHPYTHPHTHTPTHQSSEVQPTHPPTHHCCVYPASAPGVYPAWWPPTHPHTHPPTHTPTHPPTNLCT